MVEVESKRDGADFSPLLHELLVDPGLGGEEATKKGKHGRPFLRGVHCGSGCGGDSGGLPCPCSIEKVVEEGGTAAVVIAPTARMPLVGEEVGPINGHAPRLTVVDEINEGCPERPAVPSGAASESACWGGGTTEPALPAVSIARPRSAMATAPPAAESSASAAAAAIAAAVAATGMSTNLSTFGGAPGPPTPGDEEDAGRRRCRRDAAGAADGASISSAPLTLLPPLSLLLVLVAPPPQLPLLILREVEVAVVEELPLLPSHPPVDWRARAREGSVEAAEESKGAPPNPPSRRRRGAMLHTGGVVRLLPLRWSKWGGASCS